MTPALAIVIATQFNNDLDEAFFVAEHLHRTHARPPNWVVDLLGPQRPGDWHDTNSWYARH